MSLNLDLHLKVILICVIISIAHGQFARDSIRDRVFEKTQNQPEDPSINRGPKIPKFIQPNARPITPVNPRKSIYETNHGQVIQRTPEEINQKMRLLIERRKLEMERIYHKKIERPGDLNLTYGSPCTPVPEDSLVTDDCVRSSIPHPRVAIYSGALFCDVQTKKCICALGLPDSARMSPKVQPLPREQQKQRFLQNSRYPGNPRRMIRQLPQANFQNANFQPRPYVPNEQQKSNQQTPSWQNMPYRANPNRNRHIKPQIPTERFNGYLCLAFSGELCREHEDCSESLCKEMPRQQIPPISPAYTYDDEESGDEAERYCTYRPGQLGTGGYPGAPPRPFGGSGNENQLDPSLGTSSHGFSAKPLQIEVMIFVHIIQILFG